MARATIWRCGTGGADVRVDETATPASSPRPRAVPAVTRPSGIRAHVQICRVDHWFKNVFMLPGRGPRDLHRAARRRRRASAWRLVVALLATCLVASSNYVLNELLDAPYDLHHPTKRHRPVPVGSRERPASRTRSGSRCASSGSALGRARQRRARAHAVRALGHGLLYNVPPVRTKDHPYVDVAVRVDQQPDPHAPRLVRRHDHGGRRRSSLLVSYWMIGCFFMAMKRFAEYRDFDRAPASTRRPLPQVVRALHEERLLVSIMFYASRRCSSSACSSCATASS